MSSDGFEGWDLKYMANDVYLLTLERFYLWSSVTRKVSSVALPIRGCIDGPKNRIHAIVSDYRNDFNADVFVVVDADPTITQYVLPNPAVTAPLYVEGVHYNPVCFWGSSELTHQTIPITSYMITNLVTCKMSVCIDGRSFMKRGEPSHLGELENGFLEGDPLLKLWRYQPGAQRITAKGPLHLDILNALDKDEATVSIERHSKFSRIDERYLSAWDQKFNVYAVHVEGTNWVEVISEKQLYIPLSQVEEDGCIDGWDLAAVNGHVFLLTHTRLYHFDTTTIKIDVLALPVKGVTKGPQHRMFTTSYHLEAIDGRRPTVDIVVAVDDLLILYAVQSTTNQLACLQMHNPGVGRITVLAPGRDFWVAGPKGIASGLRSSRIRDDHIHFRYLAGDVTLPTELPAFERNDLRQVYPVPGGDRICLYNGNLVRYSYAYWARQLYRPPLPKGPYAYFLDANTEKMSFLILTKSKQCAYVELSHHSLGWQVDMECDAPVFMATIDYEPFCSYHTPHFWYFDNAANLEQDRPKINQPFRFLSINRRNCQIIIYMDSGLFIPRSAFSPRDLPADSSPDFKVVKVACIVTPLVNRIIVATEHFLLMETRSGYIEVHVIDKMSRLSQTPSNESTDPISEDNIRGRKIVDMAVSAHSHDIIVLLECGYVVHYEWGLTTLFQVAYRQGRWKSLNGMSIARSFLGIGYFGVLPSTKVFGYAERIMDDGRKILVAAIETVFNDDEVLVVHLQDLRETASLNSDLLSLWHNDDRHEKLLLSVQNPRSLQDVSWVLPMISRTYLRAPLITYKIKKIVAEPMDEFGFSLLAVIGTGLTLLVYQPELEKLTVLNEHFPRYPCVDVAFSMVRKVEVEGKTCIRGFIILSTEADIELLDFLFKGDPTVKDWATKQPVGTPQAPILRRRVMNVGPRICKLYVPTTYETLRHQRLAIFYVACCPKNERDFFIGALVVTEAPLSKKPGVKPQMRRSHERIPCVGTFQPGQEFQLMLKRIPDVVCPTVQVYYRLSTDPERFKFGTWDLKAKTLVFDKEVAAFESVEDNGKIYSLKWQGSYYSVKTRLVDPKRQLPSAAESGTTFYLHQQDGAFGWLSPKKTNGKQNFFPDKCLTERAKRADLQKWAPILRNHAVLYNEDQMHIIRACPCLSNKIG
ncbi:unnamed protein product, partial [Mesorhabditis spiculigera]